MKKTIQEIKAAIVLTTKDCLSNSSLLFELSLAPFVYAIVSIYLYKEQNSANAVFYMLLGAGAMGMWESTLLGGAWSLRDEKEQGILEYYLCAPTKLLSIILGKCFVYTIIGIVVIIEVFIIIMLNFDFSNVFIDYYKLIPSLLLLIFSFSIMGYILSFVFLLMRSFVHFSNILSDGIKLFCGVLFPITVLPGIFRVLSVVLPPTWGVEVVRTSLSKAGNSYTTFGSAALMVLALTAMYMIFTICVYKIIETKIRKMGELSKF